MPILDWKYAVALPLFQNDGCTVPHCPYTRQSMPKQNFCALNLSDALIRAGYVLQKASNVNYCAHPIARVRNADGMARICNVQASGTESSGYDFSGWNNRPSWKGIVYFEGGFQNATGHIDFWDGIKGAHGTYSDADIVWFWRLG